MATLGIAKEFLREFGTLERSVQDRVYETFAKFEQATFSGIHLEPIKNVRDSRLRSIRIDQYWRGVVLAPESGDSYTLLRVLTHDEAYRWAQRQTASVNRVTGAIELRDTVAIESTIPALSEQTTHAAERLFGTVSDADLHRLGVDEQVLTFARTLTTVEQLDAARGMLPEPQYDVLVGLASGLSPEQVWAEVAGVGVEPGEFDPEDVTAALARSAKQVVLVSGPDELMEVFSYPFALWRVYLHPAQQRAAYGTFSGPARVTGGPGTGKTVAVLHRAKHLAEQSATDRSILVTTFTRTLIGALEDQLRMLVVDEDLLRRIEVRHVDQVANRVVTAERGRLTILTANEQRDLWREVIDQTGVDATEPFLTQEWRNVVLAHNVTDLPAYLAAPRRGRGRPLGQRQKERIWAAISAFTGELATRDRWTHEMVCVEAARLLAAREPKPYRHIVVDEAQDLGPWGWRLLRAAVPAASNDIFLASDTHQRIYGNRVSLRQVGVNIAGRSEKLRLNYRTTAEILAWSLGLLHGQRIDDMNEDLETLAGCRSDVHGEPPSLHGAPTQRDELAALVADVRGWLASGVAPSQIGIAARSGALVNDTVSALTAAGLPAVSLGKRAATDTEIAVATMHRMKGLEFRCVAVTGLSDQLVPHPAAITSAAEDPRTHELDLQQERCVLFVACTRARETLRVSWHGRPSTLLVGDPGPPRRGA